MDFCATVVSTWVMFVMVPLGMLCQNPVLKIDGNTNSPTTLTCGAQVVFVCTVNAPPVFQLEWLIDSLPVASCPSSSACSSTGAPSHYSFTKNSANTIYNLTIDPITHDDTKSFVCNNDNSDKSNTIATTVEAQFVEAMFTNDTIIEVNTVTVIATTNCLTTPSSVQVYLTHKLVSPSNVFEDYSDGTSNRNITQCTIANNPDCGGNAASKINTTMNIPTSSNGEVHTFRLVVTENNVVVYQSILGNYSIEDNTNYTVSTVRTTSPQSTQRTNSPTPSPTTETNTPSDKSSCVTSSHFTTTDNPRCFIPESYIYLIVGVVLIIVVLFAFIIHVVFICVKGNKRKENKLDNIQSPEQTDENTDLEYDVCVL